MKKKEIDVNMKLGKGVPVYILFQFVFIVITLLTHSILLHC